MAQPRNSKARLALLGDLMKLLRQRRRPVQSVVIHPDGTIEVRLGPPSDADIEKAKIDKELAEFRRSHGY